MKFDDLPERYRDQAAAQLGTRTGTDLHGRTRTLTSRSGERPRGGMNPTERAYAARLERLKRAGEISDYKFEAVKLRLARTTFYTPDFLVEWASGKVELHEVKGFWRDDARVKIKVAAEMYGMWKFVAVKKIKGGWEYEWF